MAMKLDFQTGGKEGGPVLLLVHAMGADRRFWDACRSVWDRRFQSISVSLRGAGFSPKIDRPVAIEGHADDLEELRMELGIERLVPIGCAVGAMVAACYAGRFPQHCRALVLSNPGYRTQTAAREMLKRRADTVRTQGMAAVSTQTIDAAFGKGGDHSMRREFARMFERLDASSYAFTIEGMLHADVSGYLPTIGCPTLIVAGERDALLPPADHAVPLRHAIERAEYVSVPDGAHFIPFQQPNAFASIVEEFLVRSFGLGEEAA